MWWFLPWIWRRWCLFDSKLVQAHFATITEQKSIIRISILFLFLSTKNFKQRNNKKKQDWKFQSISASQYAFWITYYFELFSQKMIKRTKKDQKDQKNSKWSKWPKKFKIIKLIKMVKMIKNDQSGQNDQKYSIWLKNWEKVGGKKLNL